MKLYVIISNTTTPHWAYGHRLPPSLSLHFLFSCTQVDKISRDYEIKEGIRVKKSNKQGVQGLKICIKKEERVTKRDICEWGVQGLKIQINLQSNPLIQILIFVALYK